MQPRSIILCAVAAAVLSLSPAAGFAGTTGVISGTVYDCGPLAQCVEPMPRVPFAKVNISNVLGVYTATTDANGFFSFVSVTPGLYYVAAAKDGYGSWCAALAKVAADEVTGVVVSVTTQRFIDHYYRRFGPTSTLSIYCLDSNGNLDH
jgi:hypothetical protein